MTKPVEQVKRGEIVDFDKFALRVEADPMIEGNWVKLEGRISISGCPYVHRKYMIGLPVKVRES